METLPMYSNAEEPISDLDIVIEGALAAGTLFRGDSLEDLQKQLGITDLVDTCATYNAACAAGEDKEFGKDPSLLIPLHENSAHYYAIKAPCLLLLYQWRFGCQ